MKCSPAKPALVILSAFLLRAGNVSAQQGLSVEEKAKQHVAELERIREHRTTTARAAEEERLAAERAAQLAKLCQLSCEVLFKSASGGIKTGSGAAVMLLRASDSSRQAVQQAIKENSAGAIRSHPDVLRQVKADSRGVADFGDLTDGNYLAVSEVRWLEKGFFQDKYLGGVVLCSVVLRPGEMARVVDTK